MPDERRVNLELGLLADRNALNRDAVLAEKGGGSYWRDREGEERARQEMILEMLSFLPMGGGLKKVMVRTPWIQRFCLGRRQWKRQHLVCLRGSKTYLM